MATWWRLCVCSLGILLLAPCSLSEEFSLAGSSHPMVGVVGRDVVLPCQLLPPARLSSMDILWRKIGSGYISVHEYLDVGSRDMPGESYKNRTELFLQEFNSGNISLKLKRLKVADAGTYHCLVRNPVWSQEATTELQISAVAPVFIDVLGPRGQGIGLACRSTGWFPRPELHWVGRNGQNLAMEIVTDVTQDRENLYSVVSHITVTEEEDNGDISCIVRNGLVETERQSAINFSGDIFPRVSPWLAAFWVLFTLVLIAAGACAYLGYTAKRKASQKKPSKEEALLKLDIEKKTLDTGYQELQQLLEAERKAFESECQEWRERLESQENENKLKWKSECDKLQEIIASKEEKIKELESAYDKLKKNHVSFKMGRKSLKKVIEEVKKRKDIPKEEKELLQEKMKTLKEKKDELLAQMGSGKMGRKSLKELMEEVSKRKNISEEKKKLLLEKIQTLDNEKDELLKLVSKKWEIEISEIVDDELQKEMGRIKKENNELKIELKWRRARTDADDITLNPDTAHPNLSICEDKKKCIHKAQPQKISLTPERFDSTVCVLGSEGFSGGKHYWEVEVVSSTDWDLGVARKSIQRKGKLPLSPKEGFWALGLSGRDYWAKTDPWTQALVQKKPKKIGIYLSYQDRQVTFFNVTDMSVLFTFNDCSFSGEVYPFFKNTHKETTLRICSIREN